AQPLFCWGYTHYRLPKQGKSWRLGLPIGGRSANRSQRPWCLRELALAAALDARWLYLGSLANSFAFSSVLAMSVAPMADTSQTGPAGCSPTQSLDEQFCATQVSPAIRARPLRHAERGRVVRWHARRPRAATAPAPFHPRGREGLPSAGFRDCVAAAGQCASCSAAGASTDFGSSRLSRRVRERGDCLRRHARFSPEIA